MEYVAHDLGIVAKFFLGSGSVFLNDRHADIDTQVADVNATRTGNQYQDLVPASTAEAAIELVHHTLRTLDRVPGKYSERKPSFCNARRSCLPSIKTCENRAIPTIVVMPF